MTSTRRRRFLRRSALGLAGLATAPAAAARTDDPPPPGMPPAFGTGPKTGPEVTPATLAEAEKLVRVELTAAQRAQAAGNWQVSMAPLYERRTGPRTVELEPELAPATRWDPRLPGQAGAATRDRFVRTPGDPGPLPTRDEDIAFARLPQLSRWIEGRKLSSERLTAIYLDRLKKTQPRINSAITITEELALEQARRADAEIAKGRYRGPLQGIPWGAKDLVNTAGIRTTWGAEPYRDRVPRTDAVAVKRLHDAGAVLVAKLSLGALALNDIWFGGQTNNPWLLEEGASGSSAGPGAATAAGCVGFALASETGGSIVAPAMRCGVVGLRPSFGMVPRTGAMTLCWSLDKLGPMARGVEDTLFALAALAGPDPGDVSSLPCHFDFDGTAPVKGLRVGYVERWMKEAPATDVDRAALEAARKLGMLTLPVEIPDWPYDSLNLVLFAESAAAFEELTLSGGLDQLKMQVPDAWPNTFRQSRFLSAVDFVQADRFRRKVALEMVRVFSGIDVLMVPSMRSEIHPLFNHTGHPALVLRAGFVEAAQARSDWAPDPAHPLPKFSPPRRVPHGITLVGRLFDEGTLGRVGIALEKAFGVADERPPGF